MGIVDRIQGLCSSGNTTLIGLEREIGLGRGTVRNWDSSSPSVEKLSKVADYFKVSTDYLLGKSPFKNRHEENHSVTIATFKALLEDEEKSKLLLGTIVVSFVSLQRHYSNRVLAHIENILKEVEVRELSPQELHDLAEFSRCDIFWPDDYQGRVLVNLGLKQLDVTLDLWSIPKIQIDESRILPSLETLRDPADYYKLSSSLKEKYTLPERPRRSPRRELMTSREDGLSSVAADSKTKPFPALDRRTPPTLIPVLGEISAGVPLLAQQQIIGHEFLPQELLHNGSEYFGLKIKGDSMNNSRMHEGDIAIVRKQEAVENGEIAIVLVDGESATVKKFYQTENTVTLIPNSSNPEHQPRVIDARETEVSVIGKVVKVIMRLED